MRVVPNMTSRDAMINAHRSAGMLVLTLDNMAMWRLKDDLVNWEWVGSGGYLDLTWAANVEVNIAGYEYQRLVCAGNTALNVTAAPLGARSLLQLANQTGSVLTLTWSGVVWPCGAPTKLAPGERLYVRLVGTPEGVLGSVFRQGAVAPKLPAQDKLAAYWTLDRQAGGSYEELMAGKALTVSGGAWVECPGVLNRGALQVTQDGTITPLLKVADAQFKLSTATAFTLRFWYRYGHTGGPDLLVCVADSTARLLSGDFRLVLSGGNLVATLFNDTAHTAQIASPGDGLWHRCVVTWDSAGGNMRLVLDGQSVTAGPVSLSGAGGDSSLNFGGNTASGVPGFAVDEIAFWRGKALTMEEIEDDFGGGVIAAGPARPVFGGSTGLTITFDHALNGSPVW
jgi:hypothetical protein